MHMNAARFDSDSDKVVLVAARDVIPHSDDDTGEHSGTELITVPESDEVDERLTPVTKDATTGYVWVAAMMAALGGILFGYDVGVISGALLQLKCDFDMSDVQQEWVISSMLVGAIIASLTGGFIIDFIGRRLAIIINSCIFVAGAAMLAAAPVYSVLILGRLIVGFGVSLSAIGECIYISEIAPPSKRGMLVSLNELGITIGFLLAYLINFVFVDVDSGWRYMFALSAVPSAIQGLGMLKLPPSPRYLVLKNQDQKARTVLQTIRGTLDVERELESIRSMLMTERRTSVLMLLQSRHNMRYRMFIAVSLVLLQQFTGQPNVLYYASTIFQQVGFSSDTAAARATLFLGITKVCATSVALLFLDKGGRRKFLLLGAFGMMVAIGAMGIALADVGVQKPVEILCNSANTTSISIHNRVNNSTDSPIVIVPEDVKYTSLIAILMFVVFYGIGFGPVTWLVLSEIFPMELRGRAFAIATVANWLSNLIVSATFLDILNAFGIAGTFLTYAGICLIGILFIFVFVPETKNSTLEEISSQLSSERPSFTRRCSELCSRARRNRHVLSSVGTDKFS